MTEKWPKKKKGKKEENNMGCMELHPEGQTHTIL